MGGKQLPGMRCPKMYSCVLVLMLCANAGFKLEAMQRELTASTGRTAAILDVVPAIADVQPANVHAAQCPSMQCKRQSAPNRESGIEHQ